MSGDTKTFRFFCKALAVSLALKSRIASTNPFSSILPANSPTEHPSFSARGTTTCTTNTVKLACS